MKRCAAREQLSDTALKYVLKALIPYTKANLKLAFSPNLFFNDLEKISRQNNKHSSVKTEKRYKIQTLRNAYYRAKKDKLIEIDESGRPRLTAAGKQKARPYQPSRLGKNAYLMVTFDIPERERHVRDHLRFLLKALEFKQVQKSVWKSEYDHRELLKTEINLHGLKEQVHVYEADKII